MNEKKKNLITFTKIGIAILSLLAVLSTMFHSVPEAVTTVATAVNGRQLPIYCVERNDKKISISFDNAWGNDDINSLLTTLKANNVKATFFMTGGWVEKYPDSVKAIAADGHDLGNHSEHHKHMNDLSPEDCEKEIMDVHNRVKTLTGKDMILFRPPYGEYNNQLIEVARIKNYYPIQWDVDSLDWQGHEADVIINKVVNHKHLSSGSIILCHGGAKHTAEALDSMIKTLKGNGFEFVPISELILKDGYSINAEGRQCGN